MPSAGVWPGCQQEPSRGWLKTRFTNLESLKQKHCCWVVGSPSSFQYKHVCINLVFILFLDRRKNNGAGDKRSYFKRDFVLYLWPTSNDRFFLQATGKQPCSQRTHLLWEVVVVSRQRSKREGSESHLGQSQVLRYMTCGWVNLPLLSLIL